MTETQIASALISWWKELTGLFLGLLALFGIVVKSKKGSNLVTQDVLANTLKIALAEHAKEEREFTEQIIKQVYDDMHSQDNILSERIFQLAQKK